MKVVRIIVVGSIVIHLFSVLTAQAAIYKCASDKKGIYYIDKPCPAVDRETKFNAVKDPKNGYVPPAFKKDKEPEVTAKGIVVGRENSVNVDPSKATDDQSKVSNLSQANSKSSGSGSGSGSQIDPVKPNGSDIVNNSSTQKNDTIGLGSSDPLELEIEPMNVEELILMQDGPIE